MIWPAMARQARRELPGRDKDRQGRQRESWPRLAWRGKYLERQGRQGESTMGAIWLGAAGKARRVSAWSGKDSNGRLGELRQRDHWRGQAG